MGNFYSRDTGNIIGLEKPLYLISINDQFITGVERTGDIKKIKISNVEYRFKLALFNKRYNEVKKLLE